MSKIYIYSTLSTDQIYANYAKSANGVPQETSRILIKGGANVMTKALVTPYGVVTDVTAEELAQLRTNEVFKLHLANGFLTISEAKQDVEKVAADMATRDQSAPLVDGDDLVPEPQGEEKKTRSRKA